MDVQEMRTARHSPAVLLQNYLQNRKNYKVACFFEGETDRYYYFNILDELLKTEFLFIPCYGKDKQRLKKDKKLFIKLKQIFITDIMSMKGFDEFSELEEYINFCEPVIQKIVFKDFDVDDGIRERFLDFISTHINSHYYSISLLALSEEDKTISEQLKHGLIKVLKKFYHYRKTKEYLEIISTYE